MVTVLMQHFGHVFDVHIVVEWRGIADFAFVRRDFTLQALDQVTDGHTRRNSVRVDNQIRRDPFRRERHVLNNPRQCQQHLQRWESTRIQRAARIKTNACYITKYLVHA